MDPWSETAALTFTCAQQESVDFGPFLVGAVLGEDESRPFFEAFHFNAETCEVFPVEGFRSIQNCPSENCEQRGFEGGVCSESVCPRTRQCDGVTGQCTDLCENVATRSNCVTSRLANVFFRSAVIGRQAFQNAKRRGIAPSPKTVLICHS